MAVLHDQADAWVPPDDFVRIRWDHEAFFGNVMVYGGVPAAECWNLLPAPLRARFEAVGERMEDVMASADDVGLIHADLHTGNAVFEGDRVKLIDFDDADRTASLRTRGRGVGMRDESDYPLYLDALRSGYSRS